MSLRQLRHLSENPDDLFRMPLFILFSTVVLMPIRIYGFVRLGHVGGWGTRAGAHGARGRRAGGRDRGPVSAPVPANAVASRSANDAAARRTVADRRQRPADGDPRGLIPYLIVSAVCDHWSCLRCVSLNRPAARRRPRPAQPGRAS